MVGALNEYGCQRAQALNVLPQCLAVTPPAACLCRRYVVQTEVGQSSSVALFNHDRSQPGPRACLSFQLDFFQVRSNRNAGRVAQVDYQRSIYGAIEDFPVAQGVAPITLQRADFHRYHRA